MINEIGFIGIGTLGRPVAIRLINAGYKLTVFDIREEAICTLTALGAHRANSPSDVASKVPVVLVCLPTPEIVREVALGRDGIVNGTSVKLYIDLSTTGTIVSQVVADGLREKDISVLDSPVSGGIAAAAKGGLTLMVSGPSALFEEYRPLLESIGKQVIHVGEKVGLGQTMKLINNLLSATALAVSSEAFVLGAKAGLDPEMMLQVVNSSSGRNSATADKFPKSVLPRTFDYGFKTSLAYKDIKLCIEQAETLGVPMWVGNAVKQLWGFAVSQGAGPMDFTTIIQYIEAWAGVEVRGKQRRS